MICIVKLWSKLFLIVHQNLIYGKKTMRDSQVELQEKKEYLNWYIVMCLDLCRSHHLEDPSIMCISSTINLEYYGYIF